MSELEEAKEKEMEGLFNVNQGSKRLNVSRHTMRAWIYQRKIPFVKLGRRVLLRSEGIEAFIAKNLVEAKD